MKKLIVKFLLITAGYIGSTTLAAWILGKVYDMLTNPIIKEIEELQERRN